jgi:glycosyltransferase involved in cell wall biosynthesis
MATKDSRIIFAGYVYGDDSLRLMKNAYCYIQPSDVEGLSPVILNVMGLDTPIICSDIKENIYAVDTTALLFKKGDSDSLRQCLAESVQNYEQMRQNALKAKERALSLFSWNQVARDHETLFSESKKMH